MEIPEELKKEPMLHKFEIKSEGRPETTMVLMDGKIMKGIQSFRFEVDARSAFATVDIRMIGEVECNTLAREFSFIEELEAL